MLTKLHLTNLPPNKFFLSKYFIAEFADYLLVKVIKPLPLDLPEFSNFNNTIFTILLFLIPKLIKNLVNYFSSI